jgi:hypothetical protein
MQSLRIHGVVFECGRHIMIIGILLCCTKTGTDGRRNEKKRNNEHIIGIFGSFLFLSSRMTSLHATSTLVLVFLRNENLLYTSARGGKQNPMELFDVSE